MTQKALTKRLLRTVPRRAAGCQDPALVAARDDDLWADITPAASRRLLLAALDAFAEHGYFATTTRQIAERAGMSPAAVYVHYPSKADMLVQICHRGHAEALGEIEAALAEPGTPTERVQRFVTVFASFHARRNTLGRVMQYELRGLPPERFREVAALRDRFEQLIRDELEQGVAAGEFRVDDVAATGVAILSLGIDVARWYGAVSDRMTPDELGTLYSGLVSRMLA
jgi:AcrR family transcriptional regulator